MDKQELRPSEVTWPESIKYADTSTTIAVVRGLNPDRDREFARRMIVYEAERDEPRKEIIGMLNRFMKDCQK